MVVHYCFSRSLLAQPLPTQPFIMPPVRHLTHRIQWHFSPLIVQTAFRAECLLTPPLMVSNMMFPHKEYGTIPNIDSSVLSAKGPDGLVPDLRALIPKPKGEVTCISRQGYNLYNEIQVSLIFVAS